MAENNENIPQQPRACPKNCRQCSMAQQIFCATSLTFGSYEVMSKMMERLERIETKIITLQGTGTELISPVTQEEAQGGAMQPPEE